MRSRAAATSTGSTWMAVGSAPSNRDVNSRTASSPRALTSSRMVRTALRTAPSEPGAPRSGRGRAARRSAVEPGRSPRRSNRRSTPPRYRPPPGASAGVSKRSRPDSLVWTDPNRTKPGWTRSSPRWPASSKPSLDGSRNWRPSVPPRLMKRPGTGRASTKWNATCVAPCGNWPGLDESEEFETGPKMSFGAPRGAERARRVAGTLSSLSRVAGPGGVNVHHRKDGQNGFWSPFPSDVCHASSRRNQRWAAGQKSWSTHSPHRGFRLGQTRRPCRIRRRLNSPL